MKNERLGLRVVILIICFVGMGSFLQAQERTFLLGLKGGPFAPLHTLLQGYSTVGYNAEGSPASLHATGFGPGMEFGLIGGYSRSGQSALLLEVGGRLQRLDHRMSLAPDGLWEEYFHQMTAGSVKLSRIHGLLPSGIMRSSSGGVSVQPYFGMGFGMNLMRWETRRDIENGSPNWYKGEFIVPDFHFLLGFYRPVYFDLMLVGEFRYSFMPGKARIEDQNSHTELEYLDMNFGGFSMELGLAFRTHR
ncbi:MAG: hypothetical protein ACETWG_07265 [Candidatus Neomarinimicrobiota bacterium]